MAFLLHCSYFGMFETTTRQLYEFGPFRLDMSRRLLLRNGTVVPLTHKAFEMLALMVENRGRVVEKDELLKEIWPDTFVEEGSLSRNISVLRKTLGEGPSENQYIQTIPKQGYRFVANVREVFEEEVPPGEVKDRNGDASYPPIREPLAIVEGRPGRGLIYFVVSLLLVAVAAIAFYRFFVREPAAEPSSSMTVTRFTSTGKSIDAAISPDGKYVVYAVSDAGQQSLWVKQVAAGSHVQIVAPADVSYQGLAFSSDGNYVYYNVWDKEHVGAIFRIPVLGGTATKVIDDVMPTIAISPDNRKIAFVRTVAATDEQSLMVANADGTDERRVVMRNSSRKGWFGQPAWSPDGKILACAVGGVGEHGRSYMQIVTVPAEGGEEKSISEQRWVDIGGLAWLHDGTALIMTASEQAQTPRHLWLLPYPSGAAKQITNDVNGYFGISLTADDRTLVTAQGEVLSNVWVASGKDTSQSQKITSGRNEGLALTWTPDGRVVYVSLESGNYDIWIMDSNGGNRKQLTIDPAVDFSPTVSADGNFVVFVSLRGGSPHIWRMNIDGTDQRQLTDGAGEWAPVCSATGPWLVYISTDTHGMTTTAGMWQLGLEGGTATNLFNKYSFLPAISPDGKRIAFSYWESEVKPERLKQAILDIEGGRNTQAFEIPKTAIGHDSEVLLRWSPDGRAITYVDNRGGVSNIWSLPLTGGEPRQITDFKDGEIFSFDWSREGKLAFARGSWTHDVVLISNFK